MKKKSLATTIRGLLNMTEVFLFRPFIKSVIYLESKES